MIEIKNIYKSFNGSPVLKGLDLNVEPGESLAIIGRSGCGKSVLLKLILGLMKPDSGSIVIDGIDITGISYEQLAEVRKKFGILFQSAALFDSMSVRENIALPLEKHYNMSAKEIRSKVEEALEMVGLPGTGNLTPSELSGGMKKRVGLARAIVYRPKYILYDEPTTGLDPIMAANINKLIVDLNHKLEMTTIAVTHDMVSAYYTADRIVMLHYGKIMASGTPGEIKNTNDPVVKQFVEGLVEGPIKPFQQFLSKENDN
jgi:phospholipid/cholesterol/gamma-HCH transport system ATP-binding protein